VLVRRLYVHDALAEQVTIAGQPARDSSAVHDWHRSEIPAQNGNRDYGAEVGPLKNPRKDIDLIEASLKQLA